MKGNATSLQSRRRTGLRYIILLFFVLALVAGWTGFWKFAAGKAEVTIEGWRAREAKAGRIYNCGSQTVGGYPFRIEVQLRPRLGADSAATSRRLSSRPAGMLMVAQVYQPGLLISEFHGPLTIAEPGQVAGHHRRLEAGAIERARHAGARRSARRLCSTSRQSIAWTAPRGKTCCAPSTSKFMAGWPKAPPPTSR